MYFKFCPGFFCCGRKRPDKKVKVNFSIFKINSENGKQIILIPILSNIARSMKQGYQTMTFGQLIKHKMRHILLKDHVLNEAGRLVPDL